jgi:hypothetical protein
MSPKSLVQSAFDAHRLEGWLPIDAVVRHGNPGLLWLDMRGVGFEEPFFADTVSRRVSEIVPSSEVFTDFDALLQIESEHTLAPPRGLIFHASRCGSTAIANALKALDQTSVFSEPYAVDKLIGRLFTDIQDHRKELLYSVLIRAAVGVLGQHNGAVDYFVKFSAASGFQLERLRKIWPDVPWVFVYRDPVEIMVSNLRDLPSWLNHHQDERIAALLAGLEENELGSLSSEEFSARVLGRLFQVVTENLSGNGLLLNYREFSEQRVIDVIKFFGLEVSPGERNRIAASLGKYAKDETRQRAFVNDSETKQSAASDEVRLASTTWANDAYQRLEELRIRQN